MSRAAERFIPRTASVEAWQGWVPHDRATLVFVIRDGQILLIRKKRGLGAGKINGPGGKLDAGETFLSCAIREVEEELCVTPLELEERGALWFQFVNGGGYGMEVRVFVAAGCRGEPCETSEAVPLWTSLACIPYDEMWADDRVWLPLLLAGQPVRGRFIYDGDVMLAHELDPAQDPGLDPALGMILDPPAQDMTLDPPARDAVSDASSDASSDDGSDGNDRSGAALHVTEADRAVSL